MEPPVLQPPLGSITNFRKTKAYADGLKVRSVLPRDDPGHIDVDVDTLIEAEAKMIRVASLIPIDGVPDGLGNNIPVLQQILESVRDIRTTQVQHTTRLNSVRDSLAQHTIRLDNLSDRLDNVNDRLDDVTQELHDGLDEVRRHTTKLTAAGIRALNSTRGDGEEMPFVIVPFENGDFPSEAEGGETAYPPLRSLNDIAAMHVQTARLRRYLEAYGMNVADIPVSNGEKQRLLAEAIGVLGLLARARFHS